MSIEEQLFDLMFGPPITFDKVEIVGETHAALRCQACGELRERDDYLLACEDCRLSGYMR
jgi:hypothetical protein